MTSYMYAQAIGANALYMLEVIQNLTYVYLCYLYKGDKNMTDYNSNHLLARINREYKQKEAKAKLLTIVLYTTSSIIGAILGYTVGLYPIKYACSILLK